MSADGNQRRGGSEGVGARDVGDLRAKVGLRRRRRLRDRAVLLRVLRVLLRGGEARRRPPSMRVLLPKVRPRAFY